MEHLIDVYADELVELTQKAQKQPLTENEKATMKELEDVMDSNHGG